MVAPRLVNHACPACGTTTTSPGRCRSCRRPENQRKNQRPTATVYQTKRWRDLRAFVLLRDGYRCQQCGAYPANHAGHVVPFTNSADPRAWDTTNVQCQCATCNGREADTRRHPQAYAV
jgi:5-methylcytosine-specific restriction endonuclease McrA